MSTTIENTPISAARGTKLVLITGLDNNYQTLKASSGAILWFEIDNTANTNDEACVKFYDDLTPVVGTDDPTAWSTCPAGAKWPIALPLGIDFATGITVACVKTKGTAGTDSPTNPAILKAYVN